MLLLGIERHFHHDDEIIERGYWLEHIFPQKPGSEWEGIIRKSEREHQTHRIGNLTLVGADRNRRMAR